MYKTVILLTALFTINAHATKDYGKFEMKGEPITLTEAIKKNGEEVLVKANIGMVCQMKGCWMTLEDGETKARVDFDHAFLIPKNSGKKSAIVIGKIKEKEMTVAELYNALTVHIHIYTQYSFMLYF